MGMKLYELKSEYNQLIEKINLIAEENDGEIPETLSGEFDAIGETLSKKIVSCGCAYKNHIAEADAIDAEIKKLTVRKKIATNTAEWLKKYMAACVPVGYKHSAPQVLISWRNSSSVVIDDPDLIVDDYCKIERTPIKSELKKAIESGENIMGAHIEQKQNIQIK